MTELGGWPANRGVTAPPADRISHPLHIAAGTLCQ